MTTETMEKALDEIVNLDCENEELIIEGFMDRYDVTRTEAQDIFNETKKWLWLASKQHDTPLHIDKPLLIIDEMWHTFLLHTKQYYQFCLKNFKKLVHHTPTSQRQKLQHQFEFENNPINAIKKHEEVISKQYSLIYDELGPETLLKWYEVLAQKYTPEYIESIKK